MYTKAQVEGHVREEVEEMFRRLTARYGLQYGDEDPGAVHRWEEVTVPAVVDHVWSWYWGNQTPYVIIDAMDLCPVPDIGDGIDGRRAAFRLERWATQSPRGIQVTQYFDVGGAEPIWSEAHMMEPMDSPELQERVRALLEQV